MGVLTVCNYVLTGLHQVSLQHCNHHLAVLSILYDNVLLPSHDQYSVQRLRQRNVHRLPFAPLAISCSGSLW